MVFLNLLLFSKLLEINKILIVGFSKVVGIVHVVYEYDKVCWMQPSAYTIETYIQRKVKQELRSWLNDELLYNYKWVSLYACRIYLRNAA